MKAADFHQVRQISHRTCPQITLGLVLPKIIYVTPVKRAQSHPVFACFLSLFFEYLWCDRRETRDYYGPGHGACCKGVDGRRVAMPEESVARFPSSTENDAMFYCGFMDGEYDVLDNCAAPESHQTIALSGQQHSRCSCLNMWWQRGSETDSSAQRSYWASFSHGVVIQYHAVVATRQLNVHSDTFPLSVVE